MVVNVHIDSICIDQATDLGTVKWEMEQAISQELARLIPPNHTFQSMTERRVTLHIRPGLTVEASVLGCLKEALGVE